MPPLETLLAMCSFALAASATPGPVNIIGAMTGARYGPTRALAFVTGATVSFLVVLVALGAGMLEGVSWILAVQGPVTLVGSAYLLWMAWSLTRSDGGIERPDLSGMPGFWSGAIVQGLNPKAWLAAVSSLSAFVLPLSDRLSGLLVFTLLYAVICWLSLSLWAWGGARVAAQGMRLFNRVMAAALVLSVIWMSADMLV
ncbi:LysE family translocator [Rhodobacterales bacterium]|nr:LysE family translocator [Rhodobacterales bacterium]